MVSRWFLVATLGAGLPLAHPCPAPAQAPDTVRLNLRQLEEQAMERSPVLAQNRAGLRVAEARQTQAGHAGVLPTFTLRNTAGVLPRVRLAQTATGVFFSPDTSTGVSDLRPFNDLEVNFVQPIYTFGKIGGAVAAAKAGVEAGEAGVLAKEAEVRTQVRSLYWGLKLGDELLRVIEDARRQVDSAQITVETKLDEGSDEVSQTDLFKIQVFRYEVEKRHREAVQKTALARRALISAIGLDPGTPLVLSDDPYVSIAFDVDSLETYLAMALRSRPELRQLDAGIRARSSLTSSASSDYYPQLFVAGQFRWNRAMDRADPRNPFVFNQTNFSRLGAVLGLSWNLNFWQTRDRTRVAEFEGLALAAQQPAVEAGIRLEVEKAWRELRTAADNVRESSDALKATDNWLRSEAQVFDLGVGEVKDFIDAFQANSTMRAEHAENIAAFNTALAALAKAIGRDLYPQ